MIFFLTLRRFGSGRSDAKLQGSPYRGIPAESLNRSEHRAFHEDLELLLIKERLHLRNGAGRDVRQMGEKRFSVPDMTGDASKSKLSGDRLKALAFPVT